MEHSSSPGEHDTCGECSHRADSNEAQIVVVPPPVVAHGDDGIIAAPGGAADTTDANALNSDAEDELLPAHRVVLPRDVVAITPDLEVLEHVGTAGRKVTIIGELDEACPNLVRLTLRSCLLTRMVGVGGLRALQYLELYDNRIGEIEDLAALRKLTTLDLSYNRIRTLGGLDALHSLTHLYVAANKLSSVQGLATLRSLEVLDLGSNHIRSIDGGACFAGQGTSLRELWLGRNRITDATGLPGTLPLLQRLDLQSNRLTSLDWLGPMSVLRELYLGHNGLTRMAGIGAACPRLEVLDLSGNAIEAVEGLEGCDALTDLWLGYNKVATFEAAGLAMLAALPSLEVVYFEANPVAADFEYRMRVARALPQLKQIDATACR